MIKKTKLLKEIFLFLKCFSLKSNVLQRYKYFVEPAPDHSWSSLRRTLVPHYINDLVISSELNFFSGDSMFDGFVYALGHNICVQSF